MRSLILGGVWFYLDYILRIEGEDTSLSKKRQVILSLLKEEIDSYY